MAITAEKLSIANYNKLDSIPVINQDLSISEFTPVANTYYRHTGTTNTYTQGVIYYYDGMEYKALDGAGGISDVKVNGASVVTDGVANIPTASINNAGVVTNGAQDFKGDKRIFGSITFLNGNSASESQQSYGRQYDVVFGCERYGGEVYFSKGSYSAPALVIRGSNSYEYLYIKPQRQKPPYIEYLNSSSNRGRIDFPEHSGTAMLAPSTWSSGTSGSVTLTAGLYELKASLSKLGIGDSTFTTTINFDGSTQTVSSAFVAQAESGTLTSYYFMVSNTGVVTLRMEDSNGTGEDTITFSYRKIGIA